MATKEEDLATVCDKQANYLGTGQVAESLREAARRLRGLPPSPEPEAEESAAPADPSEADDFSERRLDAAILVRLPRAHLDLIRSIAKSQQRTIAGWIRLTLLAAANKARGQKQP